jgi:cell division protein ZapD|tara:strand:- start:41842 stop:42639 length:798 start_codon:yes stop_codon:yes gene_type:complete
MALTKELLLENKDMIYFDQPLNEIMRTFLRTEFLYKQLLFHQNNLSEFSVRAAISSIIEITSIISRSGLKNDLIKQLENQENILLSYKKQPGVDIDRIEKLFIEIGSSKEELIANNKDLSVSIKDSEFLHSIKHRSTIPGGTCTFDLPNFSYWVNQPKEELLSGLEEWVKEIRPICESIIQILWLIRNSNVSNNETAKDGMFLYELSKDNNIIMITISINKNVNYYPEISAGKHRFTVRFIEWVSINEHTSQVTNDVNFDLSLCQ